MAMQVIFQHHNSVSAACFQLGQRIVKGTTANHAEAHAVNRASNHGDANVCATAFQRLRHVGSRLNHFGATGVGAGNNQWFLRPGQCLNDNVNFVLQVTVDTVNRRCVVIQRVGDSET